MITTVTMNASIDKAYYMDSAVINGTVMRVASCRNSAGGKGLNVARIVQLCGAKVQAAGLVGGYNGKYLESLLDRDGILHSFQHVDGETRSCINILDNMYGSTEYLEPGCEVTADEEREFINKFPGIIRDSSVITISGSIPRGIKTDIYGRMIAIAKAMGKLVILDSSGETLKAGIRSCPAMVKPNKDEMEQLFGVKIRGMQDVVKYSKQISACGIPYVAVSLGKDGALLVSEAGVFQGRPPEIKTVNTVGCGDSMVGAFAVALERNYAPEEALRFAVAVASANALSKNTGDFDQKQYEKLIEKIKIEKIEN